MGFMVIYVFKSELNKMMNRVISLRTMGNEVKEDSFRSNLNGVRVALHHVSDHIVHYVVHSSVDIVGSNYRA